MSRIEVIKGEALEEMKKLGDKCIDLVLIDPPYFQVMKQDWKGEKHDWDDQWETLVDYIKWIGELGLEIKRILKENGSFYIFADDKICAYIQVELDKLFKLENSITWVKPNNLTIKGWTQYRSYAPITEKLLFYSKEVNKTGLQQIYDNKECFLTIKSYLKEEKKKSGLTNKDFNLLFSEFTNKEGCRDRSVIEHYFGNNQWVFPTKEIYENVLQPTGYFKRTYEDLENEYNSLKKRYDGLIEGYEQLRRPFNPKENFTDVWTFNIIGGKECVKHPTQKPLKIIKRIIETSSKKGSLVLDCFGGSGTTAVACKELGRECILIERSGEYIDLTNERLSKVVQTLENYSSFLNNTNEVQDD
jgi:site-specific DNA-methyltransferase (adenine-specific)